MTHPEGVAEAVVWQHNGHILFLGAHGHHQNAGRANKGLETRPPGSEEAARDTKSLSAVVVFSHLPSLAQFFYLFPLITFQDFLMTFHDLV